MRYMRIKWEIIVATEIIEIVISICELNTYTEMYTRFAMMQVDLPICFMVTSLTHAPFTNID